MKIINPLKPTRTFLSGLALVLALAATPPSARANVYATNIKLNGSLSNISVLPGSSVRISYILNEPATLGVTVTILSNTTVVRSISAAPAAMGTNSVVWDGKDSQGVTVPLGTYSVSIHAAAIGYTNWTQISTETNAGYYVFRPSGIAVDRNASSPYYGRVFLANARNGPNPPTPGDITGILKLNADGSPADEGEFTTGGYAWAGDFFSPWKIRVSDDDLVYVNDWTANGWIYRWDPTIDPTNQLYVLRTDNWGDSGNVNLSGPGIFGTGTNTEIWMADDRYGAGAPNSFGVIKYNITTNGTCATNDFGTVVVSLNADLALYPVDVALDTNHNIYTIQFRQNPGDVSLRVFRYPAYDPSTNGGAPETVADWAIGGGDDTLGECNALEVDPTGTYLAVACRGVVPVSTRTNGNTQIFYATNGVLVTNLDLGISINGGALNHDDMAVDWDAVGNVYVGDYVYHRWRVYSPPAGTNQATTVAAANVDVVQRPVITSVSASGGTFTINFTGSSSDSASKFGILSASAVVGPYSPVSGAMVIAISPGVFRATVPMSGPNTFYRVLR
jgi:hypothetical protein